MRGRTLAATAGAVVATAALGGLATDPGSDWYQGLEKPPWQPPAAAFGLVWTPLYATVAASSAAALDALAEQGRDAERRAYVRALATNLALNAGWSWLFFRARRPWPATAGAAVLAASSADLTRRTLKARRGAGLALAAYPAWTAFATALSASVARRNPS